MTPNNPNSTVSIGIDVITNKNVYIQNQDRFRHILSVGLSSSNAKIAMKKTIEQDIKNGDGVFVISPDQSLIQSISETTPKERLEDVIILSPANFNFFSLDGMPLGKKSIDTLASAFVQVLDSQFNLSKNGGPMLERYLVNAVALGMVNCDPQEPTCTLSTIYGILTDDNYRDKKLAFISEDNDYNNTLIEFWGGFHRSLSDEDYEEKVLSKVKRYLAPILENPTLKNHLENQTSAVNLRQAIDNKKIILVNTLVDKIGEDSSSFVGKLILNKYGLVGISREDSKKILEDGTVVSIDPSERPYAFGFVDNAAQYLTGRTLASLEEIRRYNIGFYFTTYYIKQLEINGSTRIRDSICANCATLLVFQCSISDADYLQNHFDGQTVEALSTQENNKCKAVILENGIKSQVINLSIPD